jgi:DNA-binding CsgD family transcriptional regulator
MNGLTASLTEREMHVLEALCGSGISSQGPDDPPPVRQVADRMFVAGATVRQHLLRLYRKLGVPPGPRRRARLVSEAIVLGLAGPGTPLPGNLAGPHRGLPPAREIGTGPLSSRDTTTISAGGQGAAEEAVAGRCEVPAGGPRAPVRGLAG